MEQDFQTPQRHQRSAAAHATPDQFSVLRSAGGGGDGTNFSVTSPAPRYTGTAAPPYSQDTRSGPAASAASFDPRRLSRSPQHSGDAYAAQRGPRGRSSLDPYSSWRQRAVNDGGAPPTTAAAGGHTPSALAQTPSPGRNSLARKLTRSGNSPDEDRRCSQRDKQIHYGHATDGYHNMERLIQHDPLLRSGGLLPLSPPAIVKGSKRVWDIQLRKWRRALHMFDYVFIDGVDDPSTQASVLEEQRQQWVSEGFQQTPREARLRLDLAALRSVQNSAAVPTRIPVEEDLRCILRSDDCYESIRSVVPQSASSLTKGTDISPLAAGIKIHIAPSSAVLQRQKVQMEQQMLLTSIQHQQQGLSQGALDLLLEEATPQRAVSASPPPSATKVRQSVSPAGRTEAPSPSPRRPSCASDAARVLEMQIPSRLSYGASQQQQPQQWEMTSAACGGASAFLASASLPPYASASFGGLSSDGVTMAGGPAAAAAAQSTSMSPARSLPQPPPFPASVTMMVPAPYAQGRYPILPPPVLHAGEQGPAGGGAPMLPMVPAGLVGIGAPLQWYEGVTPVSSAFPPMMGGGGGNTTPVTAVMPCAAPGTPWLPTASLPLERSTASSGASPVPIRSVAPNNTTTTSPGRHLSVSMPGTGGGTAATPQTVPRFVARLASSPSERRLGDGASHGTSATPAHSVHRPLEVGKKDAAMEEDEEKKGEVHGTPAAARQRHAVAPSHARPSMEHSLSLSHNTPDRVLFGDAAPLDVVTEARHVRRRPQSNSGERGGSVTGDADEKIDTRKSTQTQTGNSHAPLRFQEAA